MTDLELLELAAKAAGLTIIGSIPSLLSPDDWLETTSNGPDMFWNPLTDDGDALRLAVKLNMNIDIEPFEAVAYYAVGQFVKEVATMGYGIEEATRRAIVRAAAEIGRSMK